VSTAPKVKPAKAAGKQSTSEQEAVQEKTRALHVAVDTYRFTGFPPGDWESNTPTDLRPPVAAARELFLSDADRLCDMRGAQAIRAFKLNRFRRAADVLKPCLNGWIELLVGGDLLVGLHGVPLLQVAINYFGKMLAMAKQNPEIFGKPVPWAESQTRSALNQLLGTTWFSTPTPEIKAESRKVNCWLRKIEETVFVRRPLPDPVPKDNKAIVQQWLTWQAHGWLATWLPPSTPAFSFYVDRPLEPLPQEVQDYVVEDITSYLFDGVEDRLRRAVNIAQIEHACSKPAGQQLVAAEADEREGKQRSDRTKSKRVSVVQPLLDKRGWSPNDLAIQAGVDFHTANNFLNGSANPYPSTRKKLADALGIRPDELPD